MISIQNYNRHIADLILKSYQMMIDRDNEIIRGGGSFSPEQQPLPICGNHEPAMCIDPEGMRRQSYGGNIAKIPEALKTVAEQPIVKKSRKTANKVANKIVADKAVKSLANSVHEHNIDHAIAGGAEIVKKRRGRPKKVADKVSTQEQQVGEIDSGGKFHFVKALKSVGHKVANAVMNKAISKGADYLVKQGVNYLTNPAVDEALETGAEVALMATGLKKPRKKRDASKKKRAPSRRNVIIGELMKQGYSMKEANQIIKSKNLK